MSLNSASFTFLRLTDPFVIAWAFRRYRGPAGGRGAGKPGVGRLPRLTGRRQRRRRRATAAAAAAAAATAMAAAAAAGGRWQCGQHPAGGWRSRQRVGRATGQTLLAGRISRAHLVAGTIQSVSIPSRRLGRSAVRSGSKNVQLDGPSTPARVRRRCCHSPSDKRRTAQGAVFEPRRERQQRQREARGVRRLACRADDPAGRWRSRPAGGT